MNSRRLLKRGGTRREIKSSLLRSKAPRNNTSLMSPYDSRLFDQDCIALHCIACIVSIHEEEFLSCSTLSHILVVHVGKSRPIPSGGNSEKETRSILLLPEPLETSMTSWRGHASCLLKALDIGSNDVDARIGKVWLVSHN